MNEIGAARNQLTDTTAGLDRQGKEALDSYGYAGTFDPNGVLSGVGEVNYANPFSRASLLKRSYDQGVRGNTNRMAARGQLYAGSLVNAQNDTLWNRQRGEDANVRGLQSLIGGLLSRRQQANTAFGRAEISARGSNMARWIGRLDNGS